MAFEVQRESLDSAQDEALATLRATRSTEVSQDRFDWLYRNNPDGPAVLWSIRDASSGEMAGFTVCLPRRMLVNGQILTAWNGADFSILPKFRTLGVASKLRRAARTEIDAGAAALLYSHPNEKMQVIHQRVGHFQVGQMLRFAKPLKISQNLPASIPRGLKRMADATAGRLVTFSRDESLRKPQHSLRLQPQTRFNDGYDDLFAQVADLRPIVGVRDSRYLDWRYRQSPLQDYHVLEARQADRLQGYLVFSLLDESLFIYDVFGSSHEAVLDLITEAVRRGRKRGVKSVSMNVLEQSAIIACLQRIGFRLRPGQSSMFSYTPNAELREQLTQPGCWLIHVGDRDV